jgi:hypothetical protein
MSQEELQAFIASEEIIIHQLDKRLADESF